MKSLRLLPVLLACLVICLLASTAYAQNKNKPGFPVSLSEVSQVTLSTGKQMWCFVRGEDLAHGRLVNRGGSLYFVKETLAQRMKNLKAKKKKLSKKAFKKKRKKIRENFNARAEACRNSSSPKPKPSVPGIGSGGPEVSLLPLSRAAKDEDIRYLLEKAGFGRSSKEAAVVQAGRQQGLSAAVNEFFRVKNESNIVKKQAPDRIDEVLGSEGIPTFRGIRQAWLEIILNTNNPFYEKLALFLLSVWTAADDVLTDTEQRVLIWEYINLLRQTSFKPNLPKLAVEVSHHPMMLLYLDGAKNFKSSPNENYARELMELFTMGPRDLEGYPNYTETPGDISKLARRLTGWRVIEVPSPKGGTHWIPVYSPGDHAPGPETLFAGTAHACSVDTDVEVIDCIFKNHPNVANYYASEILKFYLTPQPPRVLVERLAEVIKKHNFNLLEPLRILFNSEAFYHPSYRDSLAKNSLEYAAEVIRTLDIPVSIVNVEQQIVRMDMAITKAPTVFWWDNSTWTSPPVNLEKANFLARIIRDVNSQKGADVNNPIWLPAKILPLGEEVLARDVVKLAASKLGVPVTKDREDSLVHYMTHTLGSNGSYTQYSYDHRLEAHHRKKALGVYYILALSPAFQLK